MLPVVGISELAGVGCFVHNNRRKDNKGWTEWARLGLWALGDNINRKGTAHERVRENDETHAYLFMSLEGA